MNRYLLSLLLFFPLSATVAQEVILSDSVIYINSKPVAFYYKTLNETMPHYNMTVYGLNRKLLIKAEVLKFDAPVLELKPFYYYELSFPPLSDTLTLYAEDQAFSLVLSKIIMDYHLISNDELNKEAVNDFKNNYPGGPALLAKIKEYENFLTVTRNFNLQVKRDRTKPVTIKDDRLIIQDGKTIGKILRKPFSSHASVRTAANEQIRENETFMVTFVNDMEIDLVRVGGGPNQLTFDYRNFEYGEKLYKRSLPYNKTKGGYYDYQLRRICYLVENFAL